MSTVSRTDVLATPSAAPRVGTARAGELAHILAALVAFACIAAALVVGTNYAEAVENTFVHVLAPSVFLQKSLGSVLQRAAFDQPDLVPLFGSSELRVGAPYRAGDVFANYPTGFNVFYIGLHAADSITFAEQLAAIGSDARGKKIVIILSSEFFLQPEMEPDAYAFNFSPLQAYETAFNTDLPFDLRHRLAQRMLQYPSTLRNDGLLQFALRNLASDSPLNHLLYYATFPLGRLEISILTLQDHWETLNYIWRQKDLVPTVQRVPKQINWGTLVINADHDYRQYAKYNPFGFLDSFWTANKNKLTDASQTLTDDQFRAQWKNSAEWNDLELLLRESNELGAQPLLLIVPLHGRYYNYIETTRGARLELYDQMRALAQRYNVPIQTFDNHEDDLYFLMDPNGHLSGKGWVYYDQAIDAFYRGTLQ